MGFHSSRFLRRSKYSICLWCEPSSDPLLSAVSCIKVLFKVLSQGSSFSKFYLKHISAAFKMGIGVSHHWKGYPVNLALKMHISSSISSSPQLLYSSSLCVLHTKILINSSIFYLKFRKINTSNIWQPPVHWLHIGLFLGEWERLTTL